MIPPRQESRAFAPAGLAQTALSSPTSLEAACALLAEASRAGRSVVVLAGGTDWIVDRHLMPIDRAQPVDLVVDVTGVRELARVRFHVAGGEARVALGGGVTYWTLRQDARLAATLPILAWMSKDVGAVQIQTRGTLAGNIASASPAADGVPALMALDGVVTLHHESGVRRVALESFFTAYRKTVMRPGEVISEIDVRVPRAGAIVQWRKVGTRLAQAISKVALASVIEVDSAGTITHARFGMASVGPMTAPLLNVRALLEGRALRDVGRAALEGALASDISPIDDVRSTGPYRLHVATALLRQALGA